MPKITYKNLGWVFANQVCQLITLQRLVGFGSNKASLIFNAIPIRKKTGKNKIKNKTLRSRKAVGEEKLFL